MKRYLILLISFLTLGASAQEPLQTIRGTIIEKSTGMPIPGSWVKLLSIDPNIIATANDNGEFRLENIPVGRHNLLIQANGYNPMTSNNLMLTSAKELVLTIELEETVIVTDEVVIVSEKSKENALN